MPRFSRLASCVLAGCLAALPWWGEASAQDRGVPRADRLAQWLAAIEEHRDGDFGRAAIDVSTWPGADLEHAIADARQHARAIARTDAAEANRILLRGAALHADIARLIPDEQVQRSPRQVSVHTIMDGRWLSVRYLSIHWRLGRELLDEVAPRPSADARVLEWYRATGSDLLTIRSLAEGLPHLTRARQIFPGDPRILYLSGVLHERFSSNALQAGAASVSDSNRGTPAISSAAGELARAERYFRGSLDGDPANGSARVRHGHVLGRLARHAEAIGELRRALEGELSRAQRYMALLFLARSQEAAGEIAAAQGALERAADLFPRAQTPRIGLSHLARRSGDRTAAQREVQAVAALPREEARREDPWWVYYDTH